jgi:ferredoxin
MFLPLIAEAKTLFWHSSATFDSAESRQRDDGSREHSREASANDEIHDAAENHGVAHWGIAHQTEERLKCAHCRLRSARRS